MHLLCNLCRQEHGDLNVPCQITRLKRAKTLGALDFESEDWHMSKRNACPQDQIGRLETIGMLLGKPLMTASGTRFIGAAKRYFEANGRP